MSSSRRLLLRSGLLLGLLLAPAAFPAAARADAALDLVRSIAADTAPATAPSARSSRPRARTLRPSRVARPARPAPKLRLTAAQRGSGRIQVLHVGDQAGSASALPAVERKAPGLLAVRAR
jgi:hypothetical protein